MVGNLFDFPPIVACVPILQVNLCVLSRVVLLEYLTSYLYCSKDRK